MKYIKKYENFLDNSILTPAYEYNVGDYVILKIKKWLFPSSICAKIIDCDVTSSVGFKFNYKIITIYDNIIYDNISIGEFYINENEILRKATEEEITEYEIKKKSIEYNL